MPNSSKQMYTVTFDVELNKKYGDYRVVKYLNGVWFNERDGAWSRANANEQKARYEAQHAKGYNTMGDNC